MKKLLYDCPCGKVCKTYHGWLSHVRARMRKAVKVVESQVRWSPYGARTHAEKIQDFITTNEVDRR